MTVVFVAGILIAAGLGVAINIKDYQENKKKNEALKDRLDKVQLELSDSETEKQKLTAEKKQLQLAGGSLLQELFRSSVEMNKALHTVRDQVATKKKWTKKEVIAELDHLIFLTENARVPEKPKAAVGAPAVGAPVEPTK